MSDSLRPHELQHTRLLGPSLSPGVCSNSCPLSHWCHAAISSSVAPFSSCPQSLPASGSFPIKWFFALSGQSSGASASASVLPVNIQGRFPLGLTGLIFLQSKGLSRVSSFFMVQLSYLYTTTRKIIALTTWTFVCKMILISTLKWWGDSERFLNRRGQIESIYFCVGKITVSLSFGGLLCGLAEGWLWEEAGDWVGGCSSGSSSMWCSLKGEQRSGGSQLEGTPGSL